MSTTRTCHVCGTETDGACPTCVFVLTHAARDPAGMTADERADELALWDGVLEVPFDLMHERIEALAGRPVWTHELARWDDLVAEVRSDRKASFADVMDKLPADKPVVVVGVSS